jgi:hypothetical protein
MRILGIILWGEYTFLLAITRIGPISLMICSICSIGFPGLLFKSELDILSSITSRSILSPGSQELSRYLGSKIIYERIHVESSLIYFGNFNIAVLLFSCFDFVFVGLIACTFMFYPRKFKNSIIRASDFPFQSLCLYSLNPFGIFDDRNTFTCLQ